MAEVASPRVDTTSSWRYGGVALLALIAVAAGLKILEPSGIAGLQNFLLVFGSLLIEAVPFVLLGAVVSAAIEVFVPAGVFERLAGLPRPLQLPVAGLAGLAFPVCECGSVPVAAGSYRKGCHLQRRSRSCCRRRCSTPWS